MEFITGAVRIVMGSVTLFTMCVFVIANQDIPWWKIIVKMVRYKKKDEIEIKNCFN